MFSISPDCRVRCVCHSDGSFYLCTQNFAFNSCYGAREEKKPVNGTYSRMPPNASLESERKYICNKSLYIQIAQFTVFNPSRPNQCVGSHFYASFAKSRSCHCSRVASCKRAQMDARKRTKQHLRGQSTQTQNFATTLHWINYRKLSASLLSLVRQMQCHGKSEHVDPLRTINTSHNYDEKQIKCFTTIWAQTSHIKITSSWRMTFLL